MKKILVVGLILLTACHSAKISTSQTSKIVDGTLFSEQLNRPLDYKMYVPSNYNAKDTFPILYLLHGHGGNEKIWFDEKEGKAKIILDSLIAINKMPPVLAVSLNAGNSWYVDSKEKMESAYIKEFIPYIESRYHVKSDHASRIIIGISAGGFGALRFSLTYPQLFRAAILLSPAAYVPLPPNNSSSRQVEAFAKDGVFNDSIWKSYSYKTILDGSSPKNNYPKFYMSTGDDDEFNIFQVIYDLRTFFIKKRIPNETLVIDGGHSWDVWKQCFTHDLVRIFATP